MATLTLDELKKLPSKPGMPRSHWAATDGTRGGGVRSSGELRENLADGMDEDSIEKLNESPQGRAVMNDYLNNRTKRAKLVEEKSDGVFNEETPKGEMAREYVLDYKTGEVLPDGEL